MNMPNALLLMWKTTLDSGSKIPKYPLKWFFIIFPFKLRAQPIGTGTVIGTGTGTAIGTKGVHSCDRNKDRDSIETGTWTRSVHSRSGQGTIMLLSWSMSWAKFKIGTYLSFLFESRSSSAHPCPCPCLDRCPDRPFYIVPVPVPIDCTQL